MQLDRQRLPRAVAERVTQQLLLIMGVVCRGEGGGGGQGSGSSSG